MERITADSSRLVLVVGVHRSGTTWLQQLLLSHPRIGGPDKTETWLFHALVDLWSNMRGVPERGLDAYVSEDEAVAILRSFCDRAIDRVLDAQPGADHFLERTPRHSWHLDLVGALYPEACVVHIIRDGRHVTQSALDLDFGATSVRGAARFWRETIEVVRRDSVAFDRYREIRYEDLVADPAGETSSLLEWMQLEVDEAVRATIEARAGERVSQWNVTGPIGAANRSPLSPRELRPLYEEAGALLAELGYLDTNQRVPR